nr:hypothetical protein 10 [Gammaproteobacteria bacterium]
MVSHFLAGVKNRDYPSLPFRLEGALHLVYESKSSNKQVNLTPGGAGYLSVREYEFSKKVSLSVNALRTLIDS